MQQMRNIPLNYLHKCQGESEEELGGEGGEGRL